MSLTLDLPLQTRSAPISSVDPASRTATLVWTSGARVRRYDWIRGRHFFEELSLAPESVRLGRLQNGAPLLNSHRSGDLNAVIGVVESAQLHGSQGTAKIRFSDRADVQPILHDVLDGILRNVSQGYVVHELAELPPDETSAGLPIYRALDWEPYELSLVPIGADAGAQIRSEDSRTFPCIFRSPNTMNTPTKQATTEPVQT
ncbi:MAG: peptidase U35, partial [Pseudomonadota bacterium]|nr:peptidase U35 [Pseudomonadota bacterium]